MKMVKQLIIIAGVYLLSLTYFLIFWFLLHLGPNYELTAGFGWLDAFNVLSGLVVFPILFEQVLQGRKRHPRESQSGGLDTNQMNPTYYQALAASMTAQQVLPPRGFDSAPFSLAAGFFIYAGVYLFAVPIYLTLYVFKRII